MRRAAGLGADALAAGEVGVILVAGGSGTRLGFDGPKGTFPIGPVSSASLFQIHAEKIVALSRRHRRVVPLVHHDQPREPRGDRRLLPGERPVRAGARPVLRPGPDAGRRPRDRARCCSPRRIGWRSRPTATAGRSPPWRRRGRTGRRAAWTRCASGACGRSSTSRWTTRWSASPTRPSSGCIARPAPRCRSRSSSGSRRARSWAWWSASTARPQVIEYSDLPEELAGRREPEGRLELWAGSIAVHILERIVHRAAHRRAGASPAVPPRDQEGRVCGRRGGRSSSPTSRTPSSSSSSSSTRCRWPSAGPSSRPTGPPSSSRSRTRSGPTRPPRCTSG